MTAYTVRPATDEDIEGVAALFGAWKRHELQASTILADGFHGGRVHAVAVLGETVIGYGNLTDAPASTSGPYLAETDGAHCIPDLIVRADHRSNGVGALLVNYLEGRARDLGANGIFVSVDGGENIARRLAFFDGFGLQAVSNPGYPPDEWSVPYCVKMF